MASPDKLLLVFVSWVLCHTKTSIVADVIINTTNGMIYMDSFVAHEQFYSSLEELTRNKVKSAIEDILAHSKLDITQLAPNIDVTEYTMLQILHSLANDDLLFFNQLVESMKYGSSNGQQELNFRVGALSNLVKSNIAYSPCDMYKVAKSLIHLEREILNNIPKSIEEGVMSIMNKSEIFTEASRRGDIDVMKWLLLSDNYIDLTTALDTACLQKRIDIVRLLIESDLSNSIKIMNVSSCSKEILLHSAILTQSRPFLSLLMKEGVSVNIQDSRGFSPLYLAVKQNNLLMAKLLIEEEADVNQETYEGNTALHEAARNGMVDIAQLLIDYGSNSIHKNKFGISPTIMSEKFVITNIVQYLFNNKINIPQDDLLYSLFLIVPERRGEGGPNEDERKIDLNNILRNSELVKQMKSRTVCDSCEGGGVKKKLLNVTMINLITPFVQSLINIGVELDVESETTKDVFLKSVEKGNVEMTSLLLNNGISANTTRGGLPALHVAAMNGRTKVFFLLMGRGANIYSRRSNGRTTLHSACEGRQKAIVEYLSKKGMHNLADNNNIVPLQIAAANGDYEIIKTLVKHGANVGFRSSTTSLLAAVLSGNVKAVNFLLDNGAEIEEKADLRITPLIAAVNKENEEVINTLLDRGASVYAQDGIRGDTALHYAARNGSVKIIEMLLKRMDKIGLKNSDGKTALDEAVARRNTSVINLLLSRKQEVAQK